MDWGLMFIQRNESGRVELLEFLMNVEWENPFATTLTMTTKRWRDVSQNFRHFMNRLNQGFLGNRFRRYGKSLRVLPIVEGDVITNPHYHCVIDNPYPHRDEEFVNSIKRSWWKTELRKPEIHIEKMRDDGWITYIMKRRSKTSLLDSVDWMNTHI